MLKFISAILDLVYPVVCLNCGRSLVINESIICSFCGLKLPFTNFHRDSENEMMKALWGRVEIDFATAYLYFRKEGITQKILHQIKYKGKNDFGVNLGRGFGNHLRNTPFISGTDFLIPVPLHDSKLKSRGYNQSALICEGLSLALNIPVIQNNLVRVSFTDTQTRKGRFERWLNVSQKFELTDPKMFEGKRILIIDDVFTTGATIEACCQVFKEINGISIGIATLAVATN